VAAVRPVLTCRVRQLKGTPWRRRLWAQGACERGRSGASGAAVKGEPVIYYSPFSHADRLRGCDREVEVGRGDGIEGGRHVERVPHAVEGRAQMQAGLQGEAGQRRRARGFGAKFDGRGFVGRVAL
jgi:hypothetical protein